LLHHAYNRITLDIYTQAVSPEKAKLRRVVKMFLKRGGKKDPQGGGKRKFLLVLKDPNIFGKPCK
jgi:hypothetical protein